MKLRPSAVALATAAVLVVPGIAQAKTKSVNMGPGPKAKLAENVDVNAFFPKSTTIRVGDKVKFVPLGFHNVDLHDALEATPPSLYDVIAALDVFIYAGDMTEAIPRAFAILRNGGHFFFSCETALDSEDDLVLRASQRYAHKASHVEALCREAGFADVTVESMPLRYENNQPVQGFLVVARKPA